MKRLYNLYCLCLFCTLYPWKIQAQEGISRRALEELAEPDPLQQSALFFNITEAQFPKIPEEHEPVTVEYGYVNRSDKPLTINKVTASCGCIAVQAAYSCRRKRYNQSFFQAQRLFRTYLPSGTRLYVPVGRSSHRKAHLDRRSDCLHRCMARLSAQVRSAAHPAENCLFRRNRPFGKVSGSYSLRQQR